MTLEERQLWKKEINQKIRKTLFEINMPFVHQINGNIVAEYADGTIKIIPYMSKIYIIAGPPGIGKSISGKHFIPPFVEILNHDSLLLHY